MADENKTPEKVAGKSLKEVASDMFMSIKTPVFWLAMGFITCKFMDRKKK